MPAAAGSGRRSAAAVLQRGDRRSRAPDVARRPTSGAAGAATDMSPVTPPGWPRRRAAACGVAVACGSAGAGVASAACRGDLRGRRRVGRGRPAGRRPASAQASGWGSARAWAEAWARESARRGRGGLAGLGRVARRRRGRHGLELHGHLQGGRRRPRAARVGERELRAVRHRRRGLRGGLVGPWRWPAAGAPSSAAGRAARGLDRAVAAAVTLRGVDRDQHLDRVAEAAVVAALGDRRDLHLRGGGRSSMRTRIWGAVPAEVVDHVEPGAQDHRALRAWRSAMSRAVRPSWRSTAWVTPAVAVAGAPPVAVSPA